VRGVADGQSPAVRAVTSVRAGGCARAELPLYSAGMATRSNHRRVSRRGVLKKAAAAAAVSVTVSDPRKARAQLGATPAQSWGFTYCLNTSTIRGQKLPLPKEIELAAKAGYTAMEPWIGEIQEYVKTGGDLKDLKKQFADSGIAVVDAIGFAPWLMGDDAVHKKGLEAMKRDMELVAAIGGLRIAAPPMGAQQLTNFDLSMAAERYRHILELGDQTGVTPMLEVWGHSKTLGTLAEAAYVSVAAKHPKACILTDVYHLYKGGSGYEGLKLIDGAAMPVMHFNDYPAEPPRDKIKDEHRIYPGDGIAPIPTILKHLRMIGATTALSLELFNKDLWKLDALEVLKTGIAKMRGAVERAG
jgi:2-keto-myo-inositol isomerase